MSSKFDVFLEEGAVRINVARMQHLASLNLTLAGKRVLEVGAGIGRLTSFFEDLGCSVLSTDGRPENVEAMSHLFPHRQVEVLNLETTSDFSYLGEFDVVFCYGTLYHLQNPGEALKAMAQVCREMLLLETCVTPGDNLDICLVEEEQENPNQAFSGMGCRPTRPWIMQELKAAFGYAYVSRYQPCHHDFDLDWENAVPKKLHRSVFVGSRSPLNNDKLSEVLLEQQSYDPACSRVWIDVGAHLGQTTFKAAEEDPGLTVYAFEPNLQVAAQLFRKLPNYMVIPAAITAQEGVGAFYLNQFDAASSLLPFELNTLEQWIGGDQLQVEGTVPVPTLRLDTFLRHMQIHRVDYLKIDAQGADFDVVRSLGDRIKDCTLIRLEVTITPSQLYVGGASKPEIINYLAQHDFLLIEAQPQSYGQEENLLFVHKDAIEQVPDIEQKIAALPAADVLTIAKSVASIRPLEPYPGWHFNVEWYSPQPIIRLRRAIWEFFRDKALEDRIQVNWYNGLKLYLYLGNDLSSQFFIAGSCEPNELYYLSQSLAPGMTFLDVGANEGVYALLGASCVGQTGAVFAFEPSPREFQRLTDNIQLNELTTVTPLAIALANFNGEHTLKIAEAEHSGHNTLGEFTYNINSAASETVNVRRLDELVHELGIQQIDVIKMDIEGAEFLALQGAKELLEQFKPLLFLEIVDDALKKQGSSAKAVLQFLRTLGYQIFRYGDFTASLIETHRQSLPSCNIIAAHPQREWNFLKVKHHLEPVQTELDLTQEKLEQTEALLTGSRQELTRLQTEYHQLHKQLQDLQTVESEQQDKLDDLQQQLATTQAALDKESQARKQTVDLLETFQNRVLAMESSKFWQFRKRWATIKRRLGLSSED